MTRFRPGNSGNPRGRPKGARNLATQIMTAVSEPSAEQQVSKLEAVIRAVVDRAQSGDQRATQMVLDRVEKAEASLKGAVERGAIFTDADRETIAEIHRRLTLTESPTAASDLPTS